MLEYWKNNESFQRLSEMNKRNRASEAPNGIGIFTGGSKPVVKHVAEYERKTGKRMSQEMLMQKTFKKKNGEWSSARPRVALERFKVLCEEYLESHPEGYTQEVIERLWFEAVGGRKNRRVFAHGSFHRLVPNCRNPAVRGSSHSLRSGNLNVNQMEELKRSIEEEMRKKIEEDVRKSMEESIQRQLMKQRQDDNAMFQRMLNFQQPRYVHPNPQASTSLSPLMNAMPNLYASPNCQVGSFASHPGIMNTSFASQPTYMEQLQLAHPSIDASLFCDSRSGQVGTAHNAAAGGLFGGELGGTGSHHNG